MRYYRIDITRPATPAVPARAATATTQATPATPAQPEAELRSYRTQGPTGLVLPNALDVSFDIPVTDFATPMSGAFVRVFGIDLQTITQASDFNLMDIKVYGGMQRGLPLARPAQAALLAAGTIQQSVGNWVGTEMTLDLYFTSGKTKPETPVNLTINWRAGMLMADAIRDTLLTAFPGYTALINISPRLRLPQDQPGYYENLLQFARFCKNVSLGIIRDAGYPGVRVTLKERQFIVQDASTRRAPKTIDFTDLVGQITWLSANRVSITTVMRGDIEAGDFVSLPPAGQTFSLPQSQSQARARDPFAGVFQIDNARHTGQFRGESGTNWVTTFQANGPLSRE